VDFLSLIAGISLAIAPGSVRQTGVLLSYPTPFLETPSQSRWLVAKAPGQMRPLALQLVNRDRKRNGIAPLMEDGRLHQAAKLHADDMLRRNFYGHVNPEGKGATERYAAVGGNGPATDNLAYLQQPGWKYAVDQRLLTMVHKGWMNSASHRPNILNPQAGRFGLAVSKNQDKVYLVQMFALP
jgi:uncharacterized protein YkwD